MGSGGEEGSKYIALVPMLGMLADALFNTADAEMDLFMIKFWSVI